MHHRSTAPSTQQQGGITPSQLWTMLKPWRGWLALVGVSVLLGAVLELAPPLLVQKIVEVGPPDELIGRGGRFAALLELEAAGWDWQTDGRSVRP